MGRKGPPPPAATGKASLLHYSGSSPSVRTDASTPSSSSPARAGPSRANSAPQDVADVAAASTGKIASSSNQQTPRAPLRPTQSLGSLESTSTLAACVFGAAPVASTSQVKVATSPSCLEAPASASTPRRSPRKKLTPTTEASEDEYEPTERVRESVTPRRNPPRAAAQASSPIPQPLSPSRPAPRSPRAPLGDKGKGKERAVQGSDSEIELVQVKVESSPGGKKGRVLSLLSPSPTKRPRRRPKKIFSFTTDEQGRTVLDLTTSSPSVSSASAFSDDSDDEVIVVGMKRSSVQPSTTPQQKLKIKQEMLDASMSPTKTPRTPRRSPAIVAGSEQEDIRRELARSGSRTMDFAPRLGAARATLQTPTGSMQEVAVEAADQASEMPLDSQGSASYTPSVSITLASDSPRTSGQFAAESQPGPPGPSTPTRASAKPASASATRMPAASGSSAQLYYDASCSTPRAEPSNTEFQRPPSGKTTTGQPLTHSAVRRLTAVARTPSHPESSDSRYVRSPSGSPLSSLAPTPRKPTSRTNTLGAGSPSRPTASTGKRTHTFELIIDLPRSGASSKKAKLAGASSQKHGPAKKASKRAAERSEWDAFMDGEAALGQSADDESEREGSPSPAKRRRARPDSQQPKATTSRESSPESSGSNSDFDDLQDMLGRARTRREAGETLIPAGASSPSIAKAATTVSPPTDGAEEGVRRSHRTRQETDHYVPGATQRGKAKPAAAAKQAQGLFGAKNTAPSSSDGFDKLMRERNLKERKGHTMDWYTHWEKELYRENTDSEDGSGRNGSDDELEAPSALARVNSDTATGLAAAFAVGSDEELSPAKSVRIAAKNKAQLASKLIDEERLREAAQGGDGVESAAEAAARTVWSSATRRIRSPQKLASASDGLNDRVEGPLMQSLRASILKPSRLPSPIVLLSRIRPNAVESEAETRAAMPWLMRAICHPATAEKLVERYLTILNRLLRLSSSSTTPDDLEVHLVAPLSEAGFTKEGSDSARRRELSTAGDLPAIDEDVEDLEAEVIVGEAERSRLIARWCSLVRAVVSKGWPSPEALSTLAEILIALALDPSSAHLVSTLQWTLRTCLSALYDHPSTASALCTRLGEVYRITRPALQVAVLRIVPHASEADKKFRRWLAWSFLASDDHFAKVRPSLDLESPIVPHIYAMLSSTAATTAFVPPASAEPHVVADLKLIDRVRILSLSLSSLSYDLYDCEQRGSLRNDVDAVIKVIGSIDSRFRADARKGLAVERLLAKNLLTALAHSLTYQLRAAQGKKAGSDLSEADQHALHGGGSGGAKADKSKPIDYDPTQLKLSFGRKPKASATSEVASLVPMRLDAHLDEISDVSD